MAINSEIPQHAPPGIAEISPEILQAHAYSSDDFDTLFNQLKHHNQDLANKLIIDSHLENNTIDEVNTFARGVLYLYGLLRAVYEVEDLEQRLTGNRPDKADTAT